MYKPPRTKIVDTYIQTREYKLNKRTQYRL
jgi:hypothetical protein